MIEKLVLKNFKSHEDSQIEFTPGLTIFLGEVGAGKTSVLEAVSFALFGRYAGNVTQRQLIRRGAEKAEVSLVFSTRNGRYKVDRTIHAHKTQGAKLWIQEEERWKQAVKGATAVSKSVEDLLDVDALTFLAATYASQSEIKEMLETQPGKRRERLDKLLGIDMYEKVRETLGDVRTLVLNELTTNQKKADGANVLAEQKEQISTRLETDEKELKERAAFLEEIKDRLQQDEAELSSCTKLRDQLTQLEIQLADKHEEVRKYAVTIQSLKEKIQKAAEAEDVFKENKKFIQLARELQDEKERVGTALHQKKNLETILQRDLEEQQAAEKRYANLEARLETLITLKERVQVLETARETLPELATEQERLTKQLDETKTEALTTQNEIETQTRKVNRVIELGECPTCLQTVPQTHKEKIRNQTDEVVRKLKSKYAILDTAQNKIQTQLNTVMRQIEVAHTADREYDKVSTKIEMLENCQKEMEEVKENMTRIQARIQRNREQNAKIQETPTTLEEVETRLENATAKAELAREAEKQITAKEDLQETLRQSETTVEAAKRQLAELQSSQRLVAKQYDWEEHENVEKTVEELRADRAKTTEAVERLTKSIDEHKRQINQTENQLTGKREAQVKVAELEGEHTIIEALRSSLRDVVQPFTRKNNVQQVSEAFHSFYQELSNDNINYAAIDEEGNIETIRNGQPSPVNSLSGGETTCAALALRLAICSSLTKNQLLLLDEPTIHLDEPHRTKLKDFLGTHSFEQLIVVTHDNTFDALPAQIFRVTKKRDESVVFTPTLEESEWPT